MVAGKSNTILYIFSILITVVAYWINKANLTNLSMLFVSLGICLSVVDIRKGLIFFFIVSMAFTDYTFEGIFGEEGSEEKASLGGIYMASLGGSTLMVYWSLANLLLIFLKKAKLAFAFIQSNPLFKIFGYIIFFCVIGLLFNLNLLASEVVKTAISDIRLFVNTILGFLTICFIVKDRKDLIKYFNCFILIFLVQLILTILSSYSVSQIRNITSFFAGTESYLLGVAFIFLMIHLSNREEKNNLFSNSFIAAVGMLIIVLFLFVAANRGKMVGLGFAVFAYMIFSKKFSYILALPILAFLSIELVNYINPKFYNYFLWKFTTFNPMEEGGESSRIRYVSFINIINELMANPYYFLFGKGFGSYFEDQFVPFGALLANGGFSENWIAERKFYKPHGIILYSLLKYGVLMSLLIYYTIFKFSVQNLIKIRALPKDNVWIIAVAILISLPFFYIIMFSSKLQLMFGMLVGFAGISIYHLLYFPKDKLNFEK